MIPAPAMIFPPKSDGQFMLRSGVVKLLVACAVVLLLAAGAANSTGPASLNDSGATRIVAIED